MQKLYADMVVCRNFKAYVHAHIKSHNCSVQVREHIQRLHGLPHLYILSYCKVQFHSNLGANKDVGMGYSSFRTAKCSFIVILEQIKM